MTYDEAIETLKANYPDACFKQLREAVDISINAMTSQTEKTQHSEEDTASDCISRKAAIDAVFELNANHRVSWKDAVIDTIDALPSAQPERETAKFIRWMECKKTVNYISYTPHCKCSKCGTEFLIETIKYCYMCGAKMEVKDEANRCGRTKNKHC